MKLSRARLARIMIQNSRRTYYVDATNGDDANTGLSENRAWKTVAKVNATHFEPTDRILFKRGEVFAGQLAPTSNGNSESMITYGAYGSGNLPIITMPSSCSFYISDDYHHMRFENLDFSGATAGYATVYCYDAHDLYFYNCIIRDSAVRSGASINCSNHVSYNITLDNCVFRDNYMNGILCASLTAHDMLVKNCTAYSNGHDTSGDHGFYLGGGVIAENCTAYSNSAGGFKMNDNESEAFYYPIVRNCISYNNGQGLIITHKQATAYNNLVYGNTTCNLSVLGNSWGGYKIYFNTFVNSTSGTTRAIFFASGYSANSIIKNNLFIQDASVVSRSIIENNGTIAGLVANYTFDNNIYYWNGNTTANIMYSGGDVGSELKSWTDWRNAGAEPNGSYLSTVPDFVDRYTDFQPMTGGNLVGLGVEIEGYGTDYNGINRTVPPTCGCYDDPKPEKVRYVSSRIGNVGDEIVEVTFSTNVLADNYQNGISIKANGVGQTIISATRQSDNRIVYYNLENPLTSSDVVTWEYDSSAGSYSNIADTFNIPTISAKAVTNNISDYIVDIDHETGNLSQYTDTSGADISVAAGAAMNSSSYGISNLVDDTTADYATKSGLNSVRNKIRFRFYIDPNGVSMATGSVTGVFCFRNLNTDTMGIVRLEYTVAGYWLAVRLYNDAGSGSTTRYCSISDAPHYVEVYAKRASTNVSSDGSIDWWVDGVAQTSISGIDNYDVWTEVDSVRIGNGVFTGVPSGMSGTFYLDELKVNQSGLLIGAG